MNTALAFESGRDSFEAIVAMPFDRGAVETLHSSAQTAMRFWDNDEATKIAAQLPRHFHLLSDRELEELRPIAKIIVEQRGDIVRDWYQQYACHFGDSRTLPEAEFAEIFEDSLKTAQSALLIRNIDRYAAEISRLGGLLAAKHVPLEEVIASLQLFKNSVGKASGPLGAAFDKLCHVRIMLIVSAYFCSDAASAGETSTALEHEAAQLPASERARFQGLVGASAGMRQLYQRVEAAGATRGNLLIVGESGTGKELVARAIHNCGPRSDRPFVALNCAALPKDLIESELFGYKKGSFSGATTEYLGLFRAAEGGTLFLDEITEMSAETQSKLLRAIQERSIRPVGSTREQPVDVRVIASTNRDPKEAVADGHLRQDLYYRLQACVLALPTLRERSEDIPLLVKHFIGLFNRSLGRSIRGIEQQALEALMDYSWPGNVRELSNVIEAAFTFGKGSLIGLEDLPPGMANSVLREPAAAQPTTFAETERDLIARALKNAGGNKVAAAKQLQISRKKLYAKIEKYGLATP